MFIWGIGNGPVSWFCTYTVTDMFELAEKIAPKSTMRITGKIMPKNNPTQFLMYPRPNTLRSENVLLALAKFVDTSLVVPGLDVSLLVNHSAYQLHEDVI